MKQIAFSMLVLAVFVTAIEVVVAQHQSRKLFVEIQNLDKIKNELNEEWGRLQLEQSTWATDARIETVSNNELDMKVPDMDSIVILAK